MHVSARKCVVIALAEVAIGCLGLWAAVMFPDAPALVWLVAAIVAIVAAIAVAAWPFGLQRSPTLPESASRDADSTGKPEHEQIFEQEQARVHRAIVEGRITPEDVGRAIRDTVRRAHRGLRDD